MTVAEYLETERRSSVKREYVQGRVYALAGASERHARLVTNLVGLLWSVARKTGCWVYAADMKLRVGQDRFYYPDVMVVCDPEDREEYYHDAPVLRGRGPLPHYGEGGPAGEAAGLPGHPHLLGYLLLDSDRAHADSYRRDADGLWWREELRGAGVVKVDGLGTDPDLEEVYEGL